MNTPSTSTKKNFFEFDDIALPKQQKRFKKKRYIISFDFVFREFIKNKGNDFRNHFIQLMNNKFDNNDISKYFKSYIHIIRILKALAKDAPIKQMFYKPKTYEEALNCSDSFY